jgi:hypothetical protein
MAAKNHRGRAWARVTATVLGGFGILFNLIGLAGAGGSGSTSVSVVTSVVNLALAIAILVLLWSPKNRLYYRANS